MEAPKSRPSTNNETHYPLADRAANIIPPPSLFFHRRTYGRRSRGFRTGELSDKSPPPGNAPFQPEPRHGFFSQPRIVFHDGLSSQAAPWTLSRRQARTKMHNRSSVHRETPRVFAVAGEAQAPEGAG